MLHFNITSHFKNFNSLDSQEPFKSSSTNSLKIVKYKNNAKPEFNRDEYWNHYCRGLIVDMDVNKIVCIPTPKSIDISHLKSTLFDSGPVQVSVELILDGTMINVFYHNDKWNISTRSVIGGECRWTSNKTFKSMFAEIIGEHLIGFYEQLSKDTCYTFVMRHKENRIVSPVECNCLYLVDAHKFGSDGSISKLNIHELEDGYCYNKIPLLYSIYMEQVNEELYNNLLDIVYDNMDNNKAYHWQGLVVRINEYRFNYKSEEYKKVKSIKSNSSNPLYTYIDQRYKGILPEYLKYFPEKLNDYAQYRDKIHIMTQELYDFYCSTFKKKTTSLKTDVPYQLKPLCYELHGLYLADKKPIHFKIVQEFVNKLVPQRLYFVMKFYFTYYKPQDNVHIHFNEIEEGEIMEEP